MFGGWIEQAYLSYQVLDNLVSLDEDHNVVPWLAETWESSDDGLTWTFTLKPDVTFTDGSPLTAEAVAYNFDYWVTGGNSTANVWLGGYYESAEAVDDLTLQINLSKPYPRLADNLTQGYFGIQSQEALETRTKEENCAAPIGTGAFVVQEWNRGQNILLVRNDDYTSPPANALHTGPAYVEQIDWRFVADPTTRVAALQSNEVDAIYDVPAIQWETLDTAGFQLEKFVTPGRPQQLSFNTKLGPFTDEKVRQAFAYSLDREAIVETIGQGVIPFEGNGGVSQTTPGYSQKAADWYSYDPDKANELLDDAGWTRTQRRRCAHQGRHPAHRGAAVRRRVDRQRGRRRHPAGREGAGLAGRLRRRARAGAAERAVLRGVLAAGGARHQRRLLDGRHRGHPLHQLAPEHRGEPELQQQRVLQRPGARGHHPRGQLRAGHRQAERAVRPGAGLHRRARALDRCLRPPEHPRGLALAAGRVAGARAGWPDVLRRVLRRVAHGAERTGPEALPFRRPSRLRAVVFVIARKVAAAIVVLWGSATVAFFAQLALPGDRATVILNIRAGQAQERTPEELAPINAEFGLHDPVLVQYWDYLRGLVSGDFGTSYLQFRPVTAIIGEQLGATVILSLTAIVFAWLLMIGWVLLTAGRGPRVRALGSLVDVAAAGLPAYWLGIILLLVFALGLRWFPVIGGTGVQRAHPSRAHPRHPARRVHGAEHAHRVRARARAAVRHLRPDARHGRRGRAPAPRAAARRHPRGHALGMGARRHPLGAVIVESIFSRPGIGSVLVSAVNAQDLPVVVGIVTLVAVFYVTANLLVDIAYTLIDPRLKAS